MNITEDHVQTLRAANDTIKRLQAEVRALRDAAAQAGQRLELIDAPLKVADLTVDDKFYLLAHRMGLIEGDQ